MSGVRELIVLLKRPPQRKVEAESEAIMSDMCNWLLGGGDQASIAVIWCTTMGGLVKKLAMGGQVLFVPRPTFSKSWRFTIYEMKI